MANQQDQRQVLAVVRLTEAERNLMHSAARARGYDSLTAFTKAAWAMMLSGAGRQAQGQPQAAKG